MRRVISAKKTSVVPPQSTAIVAIYYLDLSNRDFLFEPIKDSTLLLYAEILGKDTKGILVKNESNHPI